MNKCDKPSYEDKGLKVYISTDTGENLTELIIFSL